MTPIPDATPLTQMLDTDVAEEKRETWAKDCDAMVHALHKNGIVWGDAKADNFLVDGKGKLWMIDFGGSYTEGWVDEEIAETEEGDDMGVQKIVNALEDPEAGTFDPEEDDELKGKVVKGKDAKRRKTEGEQEDEEDEVEEAEEVYCYCGRGSSGAMVACDNDSCDRQWFHLECTGLEKLPVEDDAWYCKDCRST